MKVTIYELLGMIKDGKEPERVKYNGFYWNWTGDDYKRNSASEIFLFTSQHCVWFTDFLNDTVEILEEPKGIPEKIEIYKDEEGHYFIDKHCKKIYITCDEVNFMVEEFNQLLDYLKSKGE